MELSLPGQQIPTSAWRPRQQLPQAPHSLETLTASGRPPRPPGNVATLVKPEAELPHGIVHFPLWVSYFVPTTWSDIDNLHRSRWNVRGAIGEDFRRVSLYKTEKLQYGLYAVSCYIQSEGTDSLVHAVAPTKREALQKLKGEIRENYCRCQ